PTVKVRMGGSTRTARPERAGSRACASPESAAGLAAPEEEAVFTGIVEEGGACARLTVHGPLVTADASRGGSIAVNGVCLTVTDAANGQFSADIMGETLARSSLR